MERELAALAPVVYGLHGLRLRSPVPLAGFPQPAGCYDVDVCWTEYKPVPDEAPAGRLVAAARVDGSYLYAAAADDRGDWILRVPGICDFLVDRRLSTVECRLDPSAHASFAAVLVSGLVVAFILNRAGHCVLHASAVELDGNAIAFAGPSGSGKSTLAALLCAGGARLVTDDVLRVELAPGRGSGGLAPGVVCVGGSPELRLRAGATWVLDHFATPPEATETADAKLGVRPAAVGVPHVPLSVIVLPHVSHQATTTEVRRHPGAGSVAALAAVCRVTGWTDRDVLRAEFRALAEVAAAVPIVEAVIPRGQASGEPILRALGDLLSGYG